MKRRSNWYIYLITFLVAGVIVYFISTMLLNSFYETQKNNHTAESSNTSLSFKPDKTYNFNILFMLNGAKSNSPEYYMTLSYVAQDNMFYLMPYLKGTLVGDRSLGEIYEASKEAGVAKELGKMLGIELTKYVRFTKATLPEFLDSVGNTLVDVPNDIRYEDDEDKTITIINSGKQNFTGSQLYTYLTLPDYGESDPQYSCKVHAISFANCINQNLHEVSPQFLDDYIHYIIQYCSTNITFDEYEAEKAAVLYSLSYSSEPAEYYVPYGTSTGTLFELDENSRQTILRMLRLVSDEKPLD